MSKRKYKVEFVQTETFIVDVFAENEREAEKIAEEEGWCAGDYQETGDLNVATGAVFDVTDTDDPFNPINE